MVQEMVAGPGMRRAVLGLAALYCCSLFGFQEKRGQPARAALTYDEQLLEVEKRAPGFGGIYVSKDGVLQVYVRDASQLGAARTAIASVFGAAFLPAAGVKAVAGKYTVSELAGWTRRATALLSLNGVNLVDMDEERNRVVVGVDGEAGRRAVRAGIERLKIPTDAVIVEVREPMRQVR